MSREPAFGFHPAYPWEREVRVFPPCSRPAPVCAVLAGAVLTFWQNVIWGLVAVRRPFGAFAAGVDRRRPAPPKQAREFPRAIFRPFPESLKFTAAPHWISTEPKLPVTAGEITAITINVNSVVPDDATIVGRLQKGISPKRHSLDGDSLFQKRLNANYVPRLRL